LFFKNLRGEFRLVSGIIRERRAKCKKKILSDHDAKSNYFGFTVPSVTTVMSVKPVTCLLEQDYLCR
jgi:hypothetical protein